MKKIAALTMVRNDEFFLRKWVEYYGRHLGSTNLYVYFDGTDQIVPDFCKGLNTRVVDKLGNNVRDNDRLRLRYLSERAAELFAGGYDLVIGGDADEYLAVDPATGLSLTEFLSYAPIVKTASGLGLDMGQKLGYETALSLDKPFLEQRNFGVVSTRYTKASILARPAVWGSGFHRVKGENFHILPNLFLFHFGFSDLDRIQSKLTDADKLAQGWERHLNKRKRTIRLVTEKKALTFEWVKRWRVLQTLLRPPYAWNKPAMAGLKPVVEIPHRFRELL